MKKIYKALVLVMSIMFASTMLSGCKIQKENKPETETSIQQEENESTVSEQDKGVDEETTDDENEKKLESKGDVEIVVPDDQEMGGE